MPCEGGRRGADVAELKLGPAYSSALPPAVGPHDRAGGAVSDFIRPERSVAHVAGAQRDLRIHTEADYGLHAERVAAAEIRPGGVLRENCGMDVSTAVPSGAVANAVPAAISAVATA